MHRAADRLVPAEREREVRNAAAHLHAGAPSLDLAGRFDECLGELVVLLDAGRDGKDVRVDDDLARVEPGSLDQQAVRALGDVDLAFDGVRLTALVEAHHDDGCSVAADLRRLGEEVVLTLFQTYRVDDRLALDAFQARLDHVPLGRVDHDGDLRDLRLGRDEVEEPGHRLCAVDQVRVHVHVDQVGAVLHLIARDVHRRLEIAGLDQAGEPLGAGDVRPLTDHDEARLGRDAEGLETREGREAFRGGERPRRGVGDGGLDRADVVRGRSTAATDEVDEAGGRELPEQGAGDLGRLVETAEGVGETGVRVARDGDGSDPGEGLDGWTHLARTQRAVDPHDHRVRMRDREPERLDRLAGQRPPAAIDDRDRDPTREVGGDVDGCGDRRLGVEGVEDGLDQQQVDAAVAQGLDLLCVGRVDLVEVDRPERWVVHLRRERQGDVEGAERPGDEAAVSLGRLAGEAGALEVHVPDGVLQPVVGLADRGRRERVRRGDVRPGLEVRVVDRGDDVGTAQVEQVRIPLDVAVMVLEPLAPEVALLQTAAL